MMSLDLVGIMIPGVAVVAGLAGLVFGVAGTVLHVNRKGKIAGPKPAHDSRKEDLILQAKLAASSQSLRKG